MNYFFGEISEDGLNVTLKDEEAHHCAVVLRLKAGDIAGILIPEKNQICTVELIDVHKKICTARILESRQITPPQIKTHLIISPPKNNERLEWLVEKCVELQVYSIHFVKSERCIRKNINLERLKSIAQAAAKQSINPILLKIDYSNSINELIKSVNAHQGIHFLMHCYPAEKKNLSTSFLKGIYEKGCSDVFAYIGPEGDWTEKEIEFFRNSFSNTYEISLGETRLRTETAAIKIAACMDIMNNEH